MPSKIKQFNFNGCKSLRKIVIGGEVEFEGKIDLSDTPITDKNDILKVNVVDSEQEEATTAPFKDAPDGITSNLNNLKKIRLKFKKLNRLSSFQHYNIKSHYSWLC